MRNTAISWKRNQHFHVHYIHEENANKLWIMPFKIVHQPIKFLSMYILVFAKRGPGNIENLQETGQMFLNTSEKNQMVGP